MALGVVQAKKIESGSAGSVTVNSAWTVTAGNLVIAGVVGWQPSASDAVASDSINGTYTIRRIDRDSSAFGGSTSLHEARNITGGTPNLTANGGTSSTFVTAAFHEVSGADQTAPFTGGEAGGSAGIGGITGNPVTPAVTNSNANSIFFAIMANSDGSNPATMTVNSTGSTPTGWALANTTNSQELDGSAFQDMSVPFLVVSSSAGTRHGWTSSGSSTVCYSAACWKQAAAGTGLPPGLGPAVQMSEVTLTAAQAAMMR